MDILKILTIFAACFQNTATLEYPEVYRNASVTDNYHGVLVDDPYQWLEDLESTKTLEFISQQNILSTSYLTAIPEFEEIKAKLTSIVNYPRSGALMKKGNRYFHFYNSGLQANDVLLSQDNPSGPSSVLLDPNSFSEDGSVSLYPYYYGFSDDASHFVYALSHKGSDWLEGRIRNVQNATDLKETLQFIMWPEFSITKDGLGIFYSRYPLDASGNPKSTNPQIFYHLIGTFQEEDIFVAEVRDYPDWFLFAEVSHCGKYLLLKPQPDFATNSVLIASLTEFSSGLDLDFISVKSALIDRARFTYVTNSDEKFVFLTDEDAPNFRLITIDVNVLSGNVSEAAILVSEHPKDILKWANPINQDMLVLCYFVDVKHILKVHSLSTGDFIQEINLPFSGVISDFFLSKENDEFFFKIENLVTPGTILKCVANGQRFDCDTFKSMTLPGVDTSQFVMTQEFFPSKDNTTIPMFLAKKTNASLNGNTPTLLFGYGGFNVDLLPTFSPFTFAFVDYFNGIYAQVNLRGGAEYGEKWHLGGSQLNKQNSFDDFQYAAEHLISEGHTSPSKLVILGSSNGGLLVAVCVNQRPDLFAVALPDVPLMDMLRYNQQSIGSWCSEYGCSNNKTHFENLVKYSPLHNIRVPLADGQYPSVLVSTGDHDDRVLPFHSYKYIAELQHTIGKNSKQINPLMLRVSENVGHSGENTPLPQLIDNNSKSFAFVADSFK